MKLTVIKSAAGAVSKTRYHDTVLLRKKNTPGGEDTCAHAKNLTLFIAIEER